ncbi:MAG TPA: uridine kinase [Candidatus Eremiobacteraeota bacterium]|nr:MAG: Uridine kinase [bacterium ADurb.Bin363]HPZ09695.1 uridine kinase [Candidatus Eremiobacteraeota bacterium]
MKKVFDEKIQFPLLIGICGGSGSGKSEFARSIAGELEEVVIISSDNFYKDLAYMSEQERKYVNFDDPVSFDLEELYYTLSKIKKNNLQEISIPEYDFFNHTRKKEKKIIIIRKIVIIEGLFLFFDERIRNLFDYKIFIDSASGERLARRLYRDEKVRGREKEHIIEIWRKNVEPSFQRYTRFTKSNADIVINSRFEEPIDQPFLQKPLQIIVAFLKYLIANGENP